MIVELNNRLSEKPEGTPELTDMVVSLYLSAVVSAGYQLMPEDANDFSRCARAHRTLDVRRRAALTPHLCSSPGRTPNSWSLCG